MKMAIRRRTIRVLQREGVEGIRVLPRGFLPILQSCGGDERLLMASLSPSLAAEKAPPYKT